MNVHRWRKLEGSDPASYELIQKVQALQKRLIEKTEDIGMVLSLYTSILSSFAYELVS